jgi:hypothetical protein
MTDNVIEGNFLYIPHTVPVDTEEENDGVVKHTPIHDSDC